MFFLLVRAFACLLLSAMAFAVHAAEDAGKVYRVGVLIPFDDLTLAKRTVPVQKPFEDGLREHGWIEGKNVQILYRGSVGLEDLVRLPVDVLVTMGGEHEQAMRATTTVPIVALMEFAVRKGTIKSLSHPGGNVTGISAEGLGALAKKRLSLLREATGAKRVARLYLAGPMRFGTDKEMLPDYSVAARALGVDIFPVWGQTPEELRSVFAEIKRRGVDALSVGTISRLPGMERTWDTMLELIERYRLPAMFDVPRAANQGGLMAYGDDIPTRARRLSYFVDRILRGAKAGDLPVEQPSQFEFVVNLKAAESIGLTMPSLILLQADRVIR